MSENSPPAEITGFKTKWVNTSSSLSKDPHDPFQRFLVPRARGVHSDFVVVRKFPPPT
jgi:hypothetical protein